MASPRVNSSNFVALALVINRSIQGPTFVFHYPSEVASANPDHDGWEASDEEGDILAERLSGRARSPRGQHRSREGSIASEGTSSAVPWDHIAGFPAAQFANILAPGRQYHRKLFQLSLDPLYCVSCPIHVPESGRWKDKRKSRQARQRNNDDETSASADASSGTLREAESGAAATQRYDGPKGSGEEEEKTSSMTMFNLIFILNPKRHEVNELVDALYLNVLRPVNKALKYSQEHSDYVWKESKRIISMKDKAREERRRVTSLWKDIASISSLAASIQEIYEAVTQGRIAKAGFDTAAGSLPLSVQIPIPFSVPDLPDTGEEDQRGLWLTTSHSFMGDDSFEDPTFFDKNFALLLLEDEKSIINELQADGDLTTAAMVEFAKLSKPTISFHKASQAGTLQPHQVRKFAQHFIFWRRAIAVPPLHARDVYILSPNCDMSLLPRMSQEWQALFAHAPPLVDLLSDLSCAPRPYKSFAPSKAHRPLYVAMLAWLMRHGWVTQLCTFAYVVVWPEIVYEVDYWLEADELKKAAEESSRQEAVDQMSQPAALGDSTAVEEAEPRTVTEQTAEKARLERIASKAQREAAEKATAHARKLAPVATEHPSLNEASHLAGISPYIILDAKRATGRESLYLAAIARRFKDDRVAAAWRRYWKYFNGRSALERIALQEDRKRKEIWALLSAMGEHLLCLRHW